MSRKRPQHKIEASESGAQQFFIECDRLSLSLKSVHGILSQCVGDAPSFLALQEWSQGTPAPPFTRFDDWLAIIHLAVGEEIDPPRARKSNRYAELGITDIFCSAGLCRVSA